MGQAGEAVLYLLPSEMGYLEWLAEAGCKVESMDPEEALRALPPPPGRFESLSLLSAHFPPSSALYYRYHLCPLSR